MCSIRSVPTRLSAALADGRPVVALESTIFSHLGLPSPFNREALDRCSAAIREGGAIPAVTAVIDGDVRVGLSDAEHERILGPARKMAERDIPVAVAQRWERRRVDGVGVGVDRCRRRRLGVRHRRDRWRASRIGTRPATSLPTSTHSPITQSSPCRRGRRPSSICRVRSSTSKPSACRCSVGSTIGSPRSTPARRACRSRTGSNRPTRSQRCSPRSRVRRRACCSPSRSPKPTNSTPSTSTRVLDDALDECDAAGITGAKITPFVLGRIAEATDGRSIPANLALAENNARVAAQVAVAIAAS